MQDWAGDRGWRLAPIKAIDHVRPALKACLSQAGRLRGWLPFQLRGDDQKTVKIRSFAKYAASGGLHNPRPDLLSFQVLRSLISLNLL
jgi:hypothetical protein